MGEAGRQWLAPARCQRATARAAIRSRAQHPRRGGTSALGITPRAWVLTGYGHRARCPPPRGRAASRSLVGHRDDLPALEPLLFAGCGQQRRHSGGGGLLTPRENFRARRGTAGAGGLSDKASVYPAQPSGWQKQRWESPWALTRRPRLLLSDEVTSARAPKMTCAVAGLLRDVNRKFELIRHQMEVVKAICDSVAVLEGDGAWSRAK